MFSVTRVVSIFLLGCLTVSFNSMAQGNNVAIVDFGGPGCVSVSKKDDNPTPQAASRQPKKSGPAFSIRTSGELDAFTAHHLVNKYKPDIVTDKRLLDYAGLYEPELYEQARKDEFGRKDALAVLRSGMKTRVSTIPNNLSYTAKTRIPIQTKYSFDQQMYFFSGGGLHNKRYGYYLSIGFSRSGFSDNYGVSFSNGKRFVGLKMNETEARAFKDTVVRYEKEGGIPAKFYFRPRGSAKLVAGITQSVDTSAYVIESDLIKVELFETEGSTKPWKTFSSAGT